MLEFLDEQLNRIDRIRRTDMNSDATERRVTRKNTANQNFKSIARPDINLRTQKRSLEASQESMVQETDMDPKRKRGLGKERNTISKPIKKFKRENLQTNN